MSAPMPGDVAHAATPVRAPDRAPVPRPHGLGIAVVFDWALAAQLGSEAAASPLGALGIHDGWGGFASRLIGAVVLVVWGEALRRGARPAWVLEVVLMGGLAAGGVAEAVALLTGHVSFPGITAAVVMLTFAPWAAWSLLRAESRAWFATRDPRPAPARVRGSWLALMVVWSLAFGVFVAWSQSF